MAKSSSQRLEYIMSLNAKEWNTVQAEMQKRANETAEAYNKMKNRIAEIKEALKTATDPAQITALHTELGQLTTDIVGAKNSMETWKKTVQELPQGVDKVTAAMNRLASGGTLSMKQYQEAIKAAEKQLQNFGNSRNAGKTGYGQADMERLRGFINQAKEAMAALNADFLKSEDLIRNAGATSLEQGKRILASLSQIRALSGKGDTIMIDNKSVNKIEAIDAAINKVNTDMERLRTNSSDVNRILNAFSVSSKGDIGSKLKGSINELNRMKASAQAFMRTLNPDDPRFATLTRGIQEIDYQLSHAEIPAKRFKTIMESLGTGKPVASVFELQKVIQSLETKFQHLSKSSNEFNETTMKLRNARAALKELNDATREHATAWENAVSRLKTYVMVYMGFQQAVTWTRKIISSNLELSDTLSDIQKRTRLSDEAIKEISQTLDSFDTRTTQSQLHELAATAGLLGLKSKEDIIGFTRAANEMSVALVELGSEGAAQLMKIATLTGDVAAYGTEQALIKTGSAINELTASSAASAGPIVNFISRMGAVGSQAKLTMGDLAGIGATLDALGQPIELSATSMNRFIMALQGNRLGLMASLGMTSEEMERFEQMPTTMEQMIYLLRKMSENGAGVSALGMVFDEMGSEGTRLKQTISSLIGNVDFLKEQVDLSNKAFEEGVSVTNEYNMKNNNAAAIMQRTGNIIHEYFTNSDMVDVWKGLAQSLNSVVRFIITLIPIAKTFGAIWLGVKVAIAATNVEAKTFVNAITGSKIWVGMSKSLTSIRDSFRIIKAEFKAVRLETSNLRTAFKQTALVMREMSMINIFGGIAGVAVGLTTLFLPDIIRWIGSASDGMKELKSVSETMMEGQLHMAKEIALAHTNEISQMDDEFKRLNALEKGTEAYEAARQKLAATYREQLDIAARQIESMENIRDYEEDLIALIEDENEKAQVHALAENLADAEEEAKKAEAALLQTANETEENRKAQERLRTAHNRLTKARSDAAPIMQTYLSQLATEVRNCTNAKVAHDSLTKSLLNEAKARAANAAAQMQSDQIQAVLENANKTIRNLGDSNNWSEEKMAKIYRDVVDYMTGNVKELSSEVKQTIDAMRVNPVVSFFTGDNARADMLLNAIESGKEAIVNYTKAQKIFIQASKEASDAAQKSINLNEDDGTQDGLMRSGRMKSGWSRDDLDRETQGAINLKSSTLHTMWMKVNPKNPTTLTVFGEQVGQKFASYEEATKWVQGVVKTMKDISNERRFTLEGGWVTPSTRSGRGSNSNSKENKEMNDLLKSMLAQLEAYYAEQKRLAELSRYNMEISEEEKNRQLQDIELKHQLALRDLRLDFIDTNEDAFKHLNLTLVDAIYGDEKDATAKLNRLRKLMAQFGETQLEEIKKNAKQNDLEAAKLRNKQLEDYRKQLIEYDNIAKTIEEIRKDADSSDILMNNWQYDGETYQDVQMERMKMLFEAMKMAYKYNAYEMQKFMEANGFSNWAESIFANDESSGLFMNKLQDYFDKYEDAVKKEANRLNKRIEQELDTMGYNKSGTFKDYEREQMRIAEDKAYTASYADSISFMGDRSRIKLFSTNPNTGMSQTDDAELNTIRTKIALNQELIDIMNERFEAEKRVAQQQLEAAQASGDSEKATQAQIKLDALNIQHKQLLADKTKESVDLQREAFQQMIENASGVQKQLTPYFNALNQFAEDFGSAIFGSKEERQQAAKDLLISVVKTTSQMLTQWLVFISTRKTFNDMEVLMQQQKNAKLLASDIEYTIKSLTLKGAETKASVAANAAEGISKEISKKGLVGLAISAGITVAMTALTSTITGAISKAKSEATSSGGRMVTGMLTYAEGKYPVMGNDGKVYDARYEGNGMKTGIYRGGAHFGIFSEKEPEMVLSGPTTRAVLNEPLIAGAINVLDKYGRLPKDFFSRYQMQTHADGNLNEFKMPVSADEKKQDGNVTNGKMMERLAASLEQLDASIANGIRATINMYGTDGLDENLKKRDRYNARMGR